MKTNKNSNLLQSGQAILVIALVMVGLIGALGLAVDGGGVAFLYRDAQNAADAAALAAAYARCTGGDVAAAARATAQDNGFSNTGVTDWVTVQSPVASVPNGSADMNVNNYVSVSVRATKQAYFIQILYPQGLETTATAVAHCTPATSSGSGAGYAMVGFGALGGFGTSCHTNNGICEPIEGGRLNVVGDVISGSRNARWSSGVTVSGTTYNASTNPFNPLASLNTSQFAPGGSVWERVPSNLRYSMTASQFAAVSNTSAKLANLNGLYYVTGDVNISAGNIPKAITIVATGRIQITNFTTGLRAFVDDLLVYADKDTGNLCDTTTVVYIRGSGDSRGIVYGPRGQVEVLYNGSTWEGSLVGKYVDWWPDGSTASTLRALSQATPPMVALVR